MSQVFKLKNGTIFLVTEAPGGIYNSLQLKKIAELCNQDLAIVKATEDQRLGLFIQEQEIESICAELESVGLGFRDYQRGLHQPVSCIGELCEDHEQDALGSSMDITKEIADIQLKSSLKIGINGCALCCTPCHTLDISIIGEALGYRVSLGGKGSQIPELAVFMAESVPADKLPALVRNLVQIYHNHAEQGESLLELIDRRGVGEFVSALAPYSQDAAHDVDPLAVAKDLVLTADSEDGDELSNMTDDLGEDDLDSLADDFNEPISNQQKDEYEYEDENLDITEDEELLQGDDEDSSVLHSDDNDLDEDLSPLAESADNDVDLPDDDVYVDNPDSDSQLDEIPIQAKVASLNEGGLVIAQEDSIEEDDEAFSNEALDFDDDDLESVASDDDHSLEEDLTEEEKLLLNSSDEDLSPSSKVAESSSVAAQSEVQDPLAEDFGDVEKLSEEDELDFEQRLNQSIDEEVKLIASEEIDVNENDRMATLGMLESGDLSGLSSSVSDNDSSEIDESAFENLDDEDLQPLAEDDLVADEVVSYQAAAVNNGALGSLSQQVPPAAKKSSSSSMLSKYFKFSGMDLVDQDKMHLSFESGAYIDIDLSSLDEGEEKAFSLGGQAFVVVRTREGFLLEVEGVRLFYPNVDLQQAS